MLRTTQGEDTVTLRTREDSKTAAEYGDRIVCNALGGHESRSEYLAARKHDSPRDYIEIAFVDGLTHERRATLNRLANARKTAVNAIFEMLPADGSQIGNIAERQALAGGIADRIFSAIEASGGRAAAGADGCALPARNANATVPMEATQAPSGCDSHCKAAAELEKQRQTISHLEWRLHAFRDEVQSMVKEWSAVDGTNLCRGTYHSHAGWAKRTIERDDQRALGKPQ